VKRISMVLVVLLATSSMVSAADPCTPVTHWDLQAVDEDGIGTYNTAGKVIIEGIVLNKPGNMVGPTADYQEEPVDMGGQWQIYIQGEDDDHAATAVYIGQNYELLPWIYPPDGSYQDPNWIAEMNRLNAAKIGPGDRVRVTGYYLFYKGKTNVNERHESDDANNFTIELLERGVGLPRPEVITLDDVKDGSDNFIFDSDRLTGCEYYQGRLVRINDVNFVDASDWGPDAELQITDGTKTFPVKLGLGTGIYAGSNNLTEPFDIIAIFDQEAPGWPPNCTAGYRLWVMDYDGNGSVLGGREHRRASKPGDINMNGIVDFIDFDKFAEDWLK